MLVVLGLIPVLAAAGVIFAPSLGLDIPFLSDLPFLSNVRIRGQEAPPVERLTGTVSFRRILFDRYIVFGNVPARETQDSPPGGDGPDLTDLHGTQLLVMFIQGEVEVRFDVENVQFEPVGDGSTDEVRAVYRLPPDLARSALAGGPSLSAADGTEDISTVPFLPFRFLVTMGPATEVLRIDTTSDAWEARVQRMQETGAWVGATAGGIVGVAAGSTVAGIIPGLPFRRVIGGALGGAGGAAAGAAGAYSLVGGVARTFGAPYDELDQALKEQLRDEAKLAVVYEIVSDATVTATLVDGFEEFIRDFAVARLGYGSVTDFVYEGSDL